MTSGLPELLRPASVGEAVAELARLGAEGAPLAGCTWIMRAPARGERLRSAYVSLQDLDELLAVVPGDPTVLGARVTHAGLAALDDGAGPLGALAEAARRSANLAIRNVATLGGNLCAAPFAAADLVPALLVAEAAVRVASPPGELELPVADYLATRGSREPGELVVALAVPAPPNRRSWYERLTVRGSGEYPIVGVAVSVDLDREGRAASARVAVGGVEEAARRCPAAEAALSGRLLDAAAGGEAGGAAAAELKARDGVDAPGWYRLAVLPSLVRRVVERLAEGRTE